MKYIINVPEVKSCDDCLLFKHYMPEHRDACTLTNTIVDIDPYEEKMPDCPLKPLKVKELQWIDAKYGSKVAYTNIGKYDLVCHIIHYEIWFNDKQIKNFKREEEQQAKQFCQDHYNNLIMSGLEEK